MRIINYKETIEAPVSRVFDWFMNLDENYIKWYPDSHKDFKWLSPKPIIKGSVFKLEEEFDGHVHQMIMKITEFQKDKRLSFASEHTLTFGKEKIYVYNNDNYKGSHNRWLDDCDSF
ncbi:MAG: hypothetical protein KKC46_01925 [Proteobacteria bacterium]|nr:hypothetical protein [Pseudomonadota bacterium]